MLIGDSIRLSYQKHVKQLLDGKAEVVGPDDNCRFAKYTLWNMSIYLEEKPDIIHWNNGLWDAYYQEHIDGIFTAKFEYLNDIKRILMQMKQTDAIIIWASTTPMRKTCTVLNNHDVDAFNADVKEMMDAHGVRVNDLNGLLRHDIDALTVDDGYHLNEKGIALCAQKIADVVLEVLD